MLKKIKILNYGLVLINFILTILLRINFSTDFMVIKHFICIMATKRGKSTANKKVIFLTPIIVVYPCFLKYKTTGDKSSQTI